MFVKYQPQADFLGLITASCDLIILYFGSFECPVCFHLYYRAALACSFWCRYWAWNGLQQLSTRSKPAIPNVRTIKKGTVSCN